MNSNHRPQLNNLGEQAGYPMASLQDTDINAAASEKQVLETSAITQVRANSAPIEERAVVPAPPPKRRLQRGPRWQLLLWTVLFSLPFVIGIGALLTLQLQQPLVAVLLGSVITALIGSFLARRQSPNTIHQTLKYEEMDLLEVDNNRLSAQLADTTRQKAQLAQQYQLTSMLAFRVRQIPEQRVLFETLVKGVRDLLDTDRVVVYRFNPDWSGTIVAESVDPAYPASLDETIGDPCFHQRSAAQYKNGRMRGIADIYQEPGLTDCHIRLLEQYRVRANLVVPIRQNEELFGLLIAHHCRAPRPWSEADFNLMSKVVTEVEYQLDFLTQTHHNNQLTRQAQLLSMLAFRVRQIPQREVLFETLVEGLRDVLATDRVVVYWFNPDWSGTIVAESVDPAYPSSLDETIGDPCFHKRHAAQYKDGRTRAIADIYNEPGLTDCHIRLLEQYRVRANLVVPIRLNEQLVALLIAHHCAAPRYWSEDDLNLVSQVATEVEYQLEFLHQTQENTQLIRQSQMLSMLAFRVRQLPEQRVLFETVVEGLRDLLATDRVVIYRFNPDWTGTIVAESVDPAYPASLDETIGDPCFLERSAAQYKEGRTRAIADIYKEPGLTDCHIRMLEQYRVHANLVVPIRHNEELFGLLIAHHCAGPRHWSEADLNLASQVATEVEYQLEFLIQTQQNAQMVRQSQMLSMLAFRVRQLPEQRVLFETVVEGLRDLMATDRVVIYKFNPDWTGTVVAESVDSAYPASLDETIGDPCFLERSAAQYKEGRTRAIADIYKEPGLTDCHIRMLEQYRVHANLVVPIRHNEELFGLLIAHHCAGPRHWSEADLNLASQVATEVEYQLEFLIQAQQRAESSKHAWFLGDISFRARQTRDLDDLFHSTVKGLRQMVAADRVMVYKFNADWTGTMVAESVGNGFVSVLNEKIDDPCFRGRYVDLYRNGRVRGINNIRKEPGLTECHVRLLEKYDVKANLIAPLRFEEELFGLLIVHQCSAPRNWAGEDLDIISQTATQLEYAVEHLHSLRDLESAVERSRLFGDIAFRARKSLDLDAVMRVVLEGGLKILQTNRLLVYRFNPDWSGTMVHEAVSSERWPRVLNTKIFDPCFKGRYVDMYRNGRVRAINDIYKEPGLSDCHVRTLEQYDVKANLVAPIRVQGELYGLLIAHHCDGGRVWTQSDMEFLSELATQTEYALGHLDFIAELENARQTAEHVSLQQRQQRETIQGQLTDLRQSLEVAFKGDLRARAVAPEGDIGIFAHFLNDSIEHLQQIVQEVQLASETVTQTAHANQTSVAKLSTATLRQSDELTEAMQTVESIADAIQQVDGNAQSAQLKVQQADKVFQEGDRAMNRAVDSISLLQTKVEETAQQVKSLGEASQNISRVVNLIRDLAGQTNVLALNASIEANSSGDQSQGFSVVAEEVRSLADQSTVATREIEALVEEIQTETNQVVSAMESWVNDVSESTELVETSRQRLNSISTLGGEIRILVEAIAQATLVQSQASTSVSHAMQDVKQISQENSQLSVSVSESFQQLSDVANRLQSRIDQFKVQ